jgi:hypothetical protein
LSEIVEGAGRAELAAACDSEAMAEAGADDTGADALEGGAGVDEAFVHPAVTRRPPTASAAAVRCLERARTPRNGDPGRW